MDTKITLNTQQNAMEVGTPVGTPSSTQTFWEKVSQKVPDFGPKNAALILGVAVFLGLLAWEQQPLHLAAVTNEQVKVADAQQKAEVLGASTLDPNITKQFEAIPISTSNDNSQAAFQTYIQQIGIIQQADGASTIAASTLAAAQVDPTVTAKQNKLISDLEKLAAPSALAEYHRLLIGYYTVIFESQQGQFGADGSGVVSVLSDQLDKLRQQFATSAGVQLP